MLPFSRSVWCLAVLFLAGCAAPVKTPQVVAVTPAEVRLVELMAERLEIGREVAWIKFQNDVPVKDAKREAEVLKGLAVQAEARGVPGQEAERFFGAQILASCEVQYELIRGWKRGAVLPTYAPKDLRRQIRPELDRIGAEMVGLLAEIRGRESAGLEGYARGVLRARGFSWRVAGMAVGGMP